MNRKKTKSKIFYILPILLLLVIHFLLGFSSMKSESPTFDEPLHITGGVFYWKFNSYHINPESGLFPQRLAVLPLIFDRTFKVPVPEKYDNANHQFAIAWKFLFKSGNDPDKIFLYGRMMILFLSTVLGLVVFLWSKEMFGYGGGIISLLLYVFCPAVLANARLTTADLAVSFAFIISVWSWWKLLHKITVINIIAASISVFILFTSKMSAVFIVPVFCIMLAVRLFSKKELPLKFFRSQDMILKGQGAQLCAYAISFILTGILVWGLIWAAYGFRYSMLAEEKTGREWVDFNWDYMTKNNSLVDKCVIFARDNKLMPEAYLFGFTYTYANSQGRISFMNGEYSSNGFPTFFPYCFLVKTPIPFLGLLFLLALAAFLKLRRDCSAGTLIYKITPLFSLLFVYGIFALTAQLNLGLRHILLFYPALYILSGGLVYYFQRKMKYMKFCILLLLLLFIYESLGIWPHYLAYFNCFAGGPDNAYRHLADSSLDWGQDLKNLKNYISEKEKKEGLKRKVYLAYFGGVPVSYYMPGAKMLPSFLEQPMGEVADYDFDNGIFCISATRLQMGDFDGESWSDEHEKLFRTVLDDIRFFNETRKNTEAFAELIKGARFDRWMQRLRDFENLRFAKLVSLLRQREPDDKIGYSILIYKMPDEKLKEAFNDLKVNQ